MEKGEQTCEIIKDEIAEITKLLEKANEKLKGRAQVFAGTLHVLDEKEPGPPQTLDFFMPHVRPRAYAKPTCYTSTIDGVEAVKAEEERLALYVGEAAKAAGGVNAASAAASGSICVSWPPDNGCCGGGHSWIRYGGWDLCIAVPWCPT